MLIHSWLLGLSQKKFTLGDYALTKGFDKKLKCPFVVLKGIMFI